VLFRTPPLLQTSYRLPPPPINHHTRFSIPPPTYDITLHYRRSQVMCHYSVSVPFSPLTVTRHISSTYSPIPIFDIILMQPVTNMLPSTSSLRYPLANQCSQTYLLSPLTCLPHPNRYPFAQIIPFFTFSSPFAIQTSLKSSSSSPFHLQPPLTSRHHSQRHSFSNFCRYQLKEWRQSPNIHRSTKIRFYHPPSISIRSLWPTKIT
jgi:hypothetical protein